MTAHDNNWKRKERALLGKWKLKPWKSQGRTLKQVEAQLMASSRYKAAH